MGIDRVEACHVLVSGLSKGLTDWLRQALAQTGTRVASLEPGQSLASAAPSADVVVAVFEEVGEAEIAQAESVGHGDGGGPFVIVVGAPATADIHALAFAAGIDEYLPTPFEPFELLSKIRVGGRLVLAEAQLRDQKHELDRAVEAQKRLNSSLLASSKRFEELFQGLPVACFTLDREGIVQEWNRLSDALFQVYGFQAFGRSVTELFGGGTDFWSPEKIDFVLSGGRLIEEEWTYAPESGDTRYLVSNVLPLTGPSGTIVGAIVATVDVTDRALAERRIAEQNAELEALNNKLERLALTDGLTGLYNHRRFQELLEITMETSDKQVSLILIDVDHFKMFNDTYGHQEGDNVLRTVAQLISAATPDDGAPARYGGEEFAVILSRAGKGRAMRVAEQIRTAIERHPWARRKVTVSIGVSTAGKVPVTSSELVSGADQALYASKHAGRNRVTHFRDLLAPDHAAA